MVLKSVLLALVFTVAISAQNTQGALTNDTIIRLVGSGVPTATIIRTIDVADSVAFTFLPGDLNALAQAKVPEDVVKAMAARSNRIGPAAPATAPAKAATPTPAAQPTPRPTQTLVPPPPQVNSPARTSSATDQYQGRGMWDINAQASAMIPHSSAADSSGFVSAGLGYFVARKSEVGFLGSGLFVNGAQDVVLGGFYRQYLKGGESRVIPFVGGAAGGNIAHASGFGTQSNFAALGEAGLRVFVARHVALEIGYTLVYVHVKGAGFSDSSLSQISFGFAHVFGH